MNSRGFPVRMNDLGCVILTTKGTGMTRENYGTVWCIDQIRPCASFNLSDSLQQKQCFHYTNLQPLFIEENLAKGAKYLNLNQSGNLPS